MSVLLHFSWQYNAPPTHVFQMSTRLDHLEAKAAYLGHREHRMLELRERDGLFRCATQRQVDVELPPWAPRFLRPRNTVTQTQVWGPPTWDGGRTYDNWIEITGVPVVITGRGALTAMSYSSRTHYEAWLMVQSRRKLLARRLEEFVGAQLTKAAEGEHEFRVRWLSGLQPQWGDGRRRNPG